VSRLQIAAATVVACTFAALVGLYAARRDGSPRASGEIAGSRRPPGMPPARFSLRDQDGRTVTADSLRGRPLIVSFLYTRCRDTCPVVADQVRGALDDLGRARVPYVAISVDPGGDTPGGARAFLLKHGLTGRARYLLGTSAQLAPVWRQFGVQPQRVTNTRRDDHTASTVVLDLRGVQRVGFTADTLTPEGLARDVRALAAARG
jgi:protein SCO1/2